MEKTGLTYIDLVYKVLESWYVTFAELTPKLIVGILVFTFFLISSKYLSQISVKLFHKFFPKSQKESSLVTLISIFRFLIMLLGTLFLWKLWASVGSFGNLLEAWE
ncbi:hypothetical protein QWZ06_03620 [Chryseobacterium tructae]|uniref:hypothetical protein n=1 Tax=Chryseobacterium tructae TaxID=1037380 RepID=UPI0025B2B09E|nr:hypothetical protein [Chryseobacterium tructae]MDN3691410.1 hypothetical protein [Chryseobacterium tructae]